jgi:hypothetical protein
VPAKWWHLRYRGGEWRVDVYDTTWDGLPDLNEQLDSLDRFLLGNVVGWVPYPGIKVTKTITWPGRFCLTYRAQFMSTRDALLFKLTLLA